MTARRRILIVVAACVALLCAFVAGRASAPPSIQIVDEKAREAATVALSSTRSTVEVSAASSSAAAERAETRVVYRDRWFRVDGSLERELEVEASQLAERRTEQTAGHIHRDELDATTETAQVVREFERRVEVQADPPRLLLGAVAGAGLDGELVYGPQAHYRIAGPLHVSGAVLLGGDAPMFLVGGAIDLLDGTLGAVAGAGLDGELVYGPQAHYRVAGPLSVSGAVLLGGDAPTLLAGASLPIY